MLTFISVNLLLLIFNIFIIAILSIPLGHRASRLFDASRVRNFAILNISGGISSNFKLAIVQTPVFCAVSRCSLLPLLPISQHLKAINQSGESLRGGMKNQWDRKKIKRVRQTSLEWNKARYKLESTQKRAQQQNASTSRERYCAENIRTGWRRTTWKREW